jgi:hypothetical protein
VMAPAGTEHRAYTAWLVDVVLYNTARPKFVRDGVVVMFRGGARLGQMLTGELLFPRSFR